MKHLDSIQLTEDENYILSVLNEKQMSLYQKVSKIANHFNLPTPNLPKKIRFKVGGEWKLDGYVFNVLGINHDYRNVKCSPYIEGCIEWIIDLKGTKYEKELNGDTYHIILSHNLEVVEW